MIFRHFFRLEPPSLLEASGLKARIYREETVDSGVTYSVILMEMGNAYIFFLSEGEERLGTLTVSIPPRKGMIGPSLSSTLLGERNRMLGRMLAERLSGMLGKIVLVSVYTRTIDDRQASHIFLSLLNRVLKKVEVKDESKRFLGGD